MKVGGKIITKCICIALFSVVCIVWLSPLAQAKTQDKMLSKDLTDCAGQPVSIVKSGYSSKQRLVKAKNEYIEKKPEYKPISRIAYKEVKEPNVIYLPDPDAPGKIINEKAPQYNTIGHITHTEIKEPNIIYLDPPTFNIQTNVIGNNYGASASLASSITMSSTLTTAEEKVIETISLADLSQAKLEHDRIQDRRNSMIQRFKQISSPEIDKKKEDYLSLHAVK